MVSNNVTGRILVSFLTYDAFVAWTWLYSQYSKINKKSLEEAQSLILYLFLPYFFIRRIAINFIEFREALNSMDRTFHTYISGWTLIAKSLVLYIGFIFLSPLIRQHLPFEVYHLTKPLAVIYNHLGLCAGLIMTLGFNIRDPFDKPLLSAHPIDFWKRWNVYMRDWLLHFIFYPAVKKYKNLFIAFFLTFLLSGIYHYSRFILVDVPGNYDTLFKFWIPGLYCLAFLPFYLRFYGYFAKQSAFSKKITIAFGIVTFWALSIYIRKPIYIISNYFYSLMQDKL